MRVKMSAKASVVICKVTKEEGTLVTNTEVWR